MSISKRTNVRLCKTINKLVNSVYRKELRNAWGDIYFVDSSINLADVAVKDDSWPVFVPYKNIKDVPNPMIKASEYADTTGTMNFYQWLKNGWQENTGITDIKCEILTRTLHYDRWINS